MFISYHNYQISFLNKKYIRSICFRNNVSRKWAIFQKMFSIKLSHFSIFGSNLKCVEKQPFNFPCLVYCEIELFSEKKFVENNL